MKSTAFFPGVSNIYILFIRRILALADQYTADQGVNGERQILCVAVLMAVAVGSKREMGVPFTFLTYRWQSIPHIKILIFFSRNGRSQMQMVKG